MSNANLYAVLEGGFPADRKQVALETPELAYTWDDIDRATACLANLLTSLKLPAGARVAVQVEKSPEALSLIHICSRPCPSLSSWCCPMAPWSGRRIPGCGS